LFSSTFSALPIPPSAFRFPNSALRFVLLLSALHLPLCNLMAKTELETRTKKFALNLIGRIDCNFYDNWEKFEAIRIGFKAQ
jgi:hypothetical protein